MAWEDTGTIVPCVAGGTISANTFVKLGSSDNTVIACSAAADLVLGVAKADAVTGDAVAVQVNGVAKVKASTTINRGAIVTCEGAATARAATVASGGVRVGMALESSTAANDLIPVCLDSKCPLTA